MTLKCILKTINLQEANTDFSTFPLFFLCCNFLIWHCEGFHEQHHLRMQLKRNQRKESQKCSVTGSKDQIPSVRNSSVFLGQWPDEQSHLVQLASRRRNRITRARGAESALVKYDSLI